MSVKGIDVSKYQGKIDWNKVKADGVEFVVIRAGYGREISQKDPYFEQNYEGAKAAGLRVGTYWYILVLLRGKRGRCENRGGRLPGSSQRKGV